MALYLLQMVPKMPVENKSMRSLGWVLASQPNTRFIERDVSR